jgi:hypothetical protein
MGTTESRSENHLLGSCRTNTGPYLYPSESRVTMRDLDIELCNLVAGAHYDFYFILSAVVFQLTLNHSCFCSPAPARS